MNCPNGCGPMIAGEVFWVCGWCGESHPRQEPEAPGLPEMVTIPAGVFFMGAADDDEWALPHEKPSREIYLSTFEIAIYPITNDHYRKFVKETGHQPPAHWQSKPPVGQNALHPVCFVSWLDAYAFCIWLSATTGDTYALPTEAQWEKAARGGLWLDGDQSASQPNPIPRRRYPTGDAQPLPTQANFAGRQGGTTLVGNFPEGASPYGCQDMSGNVSEWCLDVYEPTFYGTMPERDPQNTGDGARALRGGSWRSGVDHVRCSNRYYYQPDQPAYGIGFRVVRVKT